MYCNMCEDLSEINSLINGGWGFKFSIGIG